MAEKSKRRGNRRSSGADWLPEPDRRARTTDRFPERKCGRGQITFGKDSSNASHIGPQKEDVA